MLHYYKSGWHIRARDKTAVDYAIGLLPDIPEKFVFKKKNNRVIFRFKCDSRDFFAKLNLPLGFYHKLKSLFFPNSFFEFRSALLLENAGLSVVNCTGWASKGCSDILITENPGDKYVQGNIYWSEIAHSGSDARKKFLFSFALLIKQFLKSELFHRDFHLGNILAAEKEDTIDFIFIDTLGIRTKKNTDLYNSGVLRVLGIIKGITLEERIRFLIDAGIISNTSEYNDKWKLILKSLCSHNSHKWFGRRYKIIKGHSRYSENTIGTDGKKYSVKRELVNDIEAGKNPAELYDHIETDKKTAKKQWLYSCFLDSMGIDHRRIVAWKKETTGNDLLFLEKSENFSLCAEHQNIDEFKDICTASGIKITNINQDFIFRAGKPCLIYPDPKKFNQNRFFF